MTQNKPGGRQMTFGFDFHARHPANKTFGGHSIIGCEKADLSFEACASKQDGSF